MPIYEYQTTAEGCEHCVQPFEAMQSMSEEALTTCPRCGGAVRRLLSTFRPQTGSILSDSNLASKGFTKYVRRDKGGYEKTAGMGPKFLESTE